MANLLGNVLYKPENVELLLIEAYSPDVEGVARFIATIRQVLRSLMDKLESALKSNRTRSRQSTTVEKTMRRT